MGHHTGAAAIGASHEKAASPMGHHAGAAAIGAGEPEESSSDMAQHGLVVPEATAAGVPDFDGAEYWKQISKKLLCSTLERYNVNVAVTGCLFQAFSLKPRSVILGSSVNNSSNASSV